MTDSSPWHESPDAGFAVAPFRMHVQVAPDIRCIDQMRKAVFKGGLDFAAVLPQFRRDPREAERSVNAFLGASPHFFLAAKNSVFADFETPPLGQFPEPEVVLLGAGEILQGGSPIACGLCKT